MKGSYQIIIRNRRLVFKLEVERNITVIRGDSATGKTTLVNILRNYEELGTQSGISLSCSKPCHVLYGQDWEQKLAGWRDSIIFLDEGNRFVVSEAFARAIRGSDNYFVLVTRESLYQLPYSVDAVLEMRKTTSRFKVTYNRAYPYYDHVRNLERQLVSAWNILTEDSNAGHELFAYLADRYGTKCLSAGGKANILGELRKHQGEKMIVIADGAAFGAEMEQVYQYAQLHPTRLILYLPESFEWLIMSSGVVSDEEIRQILERPCDYINSKAYFSWEQFFTELLERKTTGRYDRYQKKKLNPYYLQESRIEQIVHAIEVIEEN